MSLGDTALIRSCLAELGRARLVEALSEEPADVRAWLDLELASLVEGNLGVVVDAPRLSTAERAEWERKATYRSAGLISPHDAYMIPFWISSAGERVGTLAFGKTFTAGSLVSVHSLYVAPPRWRTGLAARLLDASFHAVRACAGGCSGLRVGTSWTWPDAVRFYARRGLWLSSWKHELVFARQCGLPDYRVEISNGAARFLVRLDDPGIDGLNDGWEVWFAAEPRGDRLAWHDLRTPSSNDSFDEAQFLGPGTFALHLALEGWPIIRSTEQWDDRFRHSDCGEIEGLAGKIEVFEAVARKDGYVLRTPRIPGIPYRDLDAI